MNKCDLEETKHMALQKFLELSEKPENWTVDEEYGNPTYRKFAVITYPSYGILLGGEYLYRIRTPEYPACEGYSTSHSDGKDAHTEAVEKYNTDKVAFDSNQYVVAIKKLLAHRDEVYRQKKCERIKEAMEASCLKIQKAIKPWWKIF